MSGRAEKYFKYYDKGNELQYFQNPQRYNKHIFILYEMNSRKVNKKLHNEMVTNFIKYLKIILSMRERESVMIMTFEIFQLEKLMPKIELKKKTLTTKTIID